MAIIDIIFWIFVAVAIVGNVNKKKKGEASAKPNTPRVQNDLRMNQFESTRQNTLSSDNTRYSQADLNYKKQQQAKENHMQRQAQTQVKPAASEKTKPIDTSQNKSTTQLLQEKAMLDEAEHKKEKMQQMAENERIHGRLHYAQRLFLGDPVPKGKRLVYCSYCNAENLIPSHDYTTKYNCYFCREIL